eukprot:TRINITY_DN286_c0_g1_i2.p1 TRINITY_DN286_c0_g1~~TRINITY_DN286_c0_g1_i2.p1  ORF type:complete len:465 (+),score=127.76 TRINITY_DN286_c0_g1_i2:159-1553(+)
MQNPYDEEYPIGDDDMLAPNVMQDFNSGIPLDAAWIDPRLLQGYVHMQQSLPQTPKQMNFPMPHLMNPPQMMNPPLNFPQYPNHQQFLFGANPQSDPGFGQPLRVVNSGPIIDKFSQTPQPKPQLLFEPSTPTSNPMPTKDNSPSTLAALTSKSLYQPEPTLQASQQVLNEILKYQHEQKEKVESIFSRQQQFMKAPHHDMYRQLVQEHRQVKEGIQALQNSLNQLFKSVILEPLDLQRCYWLKQDLEIQMKQLDILIAEISQLTSQDQSLNGLAGLVILKHPFPLVINKSKEVSEDQLQVQLLTSTSLPIQSITQVKATMLCDASYGKAQPQKMIDHDLQSLDTNTRISKFPVKFLSGTKKAPAYLKFGMQLQLQGTATPIQVESSSSIPLVVITNEVQWEDSAGILLKREAFSSGQMEIPWPEFANTLQHHFLRATRQESWRRGENEYVWRRSEIWATTQRL